MKKVTLMIATVAILAGCGGSSGSKLPAIDPVSTGISAVSDIGDKVGDMISFSWTNPDGTKETFGASDKKARILFMWKYACASCIPEIQAVQYFTDEYKDIQFLTVCVNTEDSLNSVISVLDSLKLSTPIIFDPSNDLVKAWNASPPETFLIDKQGKIIKKKKGTVSVDTLYEFVDEAERMK